MPTGDVLKLSLFTHTTQRQFVNTHYYKLGAVTTGDAFDAAAALSDAFNTTLLGPYRAIMSDETQFGCIKIEEVQGAGLPTFIEFYDNLQGTRAGPPLPPNMALIIRRRGFALGKARRSLLFLAGIRTLDTNGSFLTPAFITPFLDALVALFNDQIIASAGLDLAEYDPVIPHTGYAYGRSLEVTVDTAAQTITITSGPVWDALGFISGGQFSIAAPNRNKGTYTATVVPASATITLSDNELEVSGGQTLSCQQVIVPRDYTPLVSAVQQLAIRQLGRRRSSHTGILA